MNRTSRTRSPAEPPARRRTPARASRDPSASRILATGSLALLVAACGDSGTSVLGAAAPDPAGDVGDAATYDDTTPAPAPVPAPIAVTPPRSEPPAPDDSALAEPADLYERDGYGSVDVIRVDLRTLPASGPCTASDQSGCTLADVVADVDKSDDLKVEIPVHFSATDFADDGSPSNAALRQRGASARQARQKSFRVELDDKDAPWRAERRLQLNKHPYDDSHIRNKLAFDLMSTVSDLPSTRTQFVELWIDDGDGPVDYGLFTHAEAAGKYYLENRDWNDDDNLYKAERFVFSGEDLGSMALEDDGEPVDEDAFEERLEIERGKDHRALVRMIEAINDPDRTFESVMAEHFDEENVLTWVTVNFLLAQTDAVTHNYYLYNPEDSDAFYFLPWDYDYAFDVEQEPPSGFATEALEKRLFYGYARGAASNFLAKYYRRSGIHERILDKAAELRRGPLMDGEILERAERYTAAVRAVLLRGPDALSFDPAAHERFADHVSTSHDALRERFAVPLPPTLATPRIEDDLAKFRWSSAHDVTGGEITYDLEIATSPDFAADDRVLLVEDIEDEADGRVGLDIDPERLGSGTRYARVVARSSRDPERFWQIASNRESFGGTLRIGVRELVVP